MFLKQLYRRWPRMFYVLLVLALAQAFFMYKAVETSPFFLYNMYSTPQRNGDSSHYTTIYLNGHRFDAARLSGHEQETLLGSLSYFRKLHGNRFFATDSATAARRTARLPAAVGRMVYEHLTNRTVNDSVFLSWWARYLGQVAGTRVDSFALVESTIAWKPVYRDLHDTVSLIHYHRAFPLH